MIKPEAAALELSIRPPARAQALRPSLTHLALVALTLVALAGVAAYVIRLTQWGDRAAWTYPTVALMYILSTATSAPLLAFATRMTRGSWALPARRVVELFAVPSLLAYALLIPLLATLPPLEGRANLWFGFSAGAPFVTDALALGGLLVLGLALLWFSAAPDLVASGRQVQAMPAWKRLLFLNWYGSKRQWTVMRRSLRLLGAMYLMLYVYVHMILTTDFGQSLLPGWKSGVFPAYHAVTGLQGALAITIVTLVLLRRFSPSTRKFIGDEQAVGFGKLLLALTLFWFYLFWSDFLVVWYARIPSESGAVQTQVAITYLAPFLIALAGLFLIPFVTLIFNSIRRRLTSLAWVSVVVLIGLGFDRVRLFVPAMGTKDPSLHSLESLAEPIWPDAVDVLVVVGMIALMALVYVWIASRIPVLAGWEMREGAMLRREQPFMRGHVLVIGKPD